MVISEGEDRHLRPDCTEEVIGILEELMAMPPAESAAIGASIEASLQEARENLLAAGLPAGRDEVMTEALRLRGDDLIEPRGEG